MRTCTPGCMHACMHARMLVPVPRMCLCPARAQGPHACAPHACLRLSVAQAAASSTNSNSTCVQCDYCDTYLTHDSVGALRASASPSQACAATSCLTPMPVAGWGQTLAHCTPLAACRPEAAQHWVQAQGAQQGQGQRCSSRYFCQQYSNQQSTARARPHLTPRMRAGQRAQLLLHF